MENRKDLQERIKALKAAKMFASATALRRKLRELNKKVLRK